MSTQLSFCKKCGTQVLGSEETLCSWCDTPEPTSRPQSGDAELERRAEEYASKLSLLIPITAPHWTQGNIDYAIQEAGRVAFKAGALSERALSETKTTYAMGLEVGAARERARILEQLPGILEAARQMKLESDGMWIREAPKYSIEELIGMLK